MSSRPQNASTALVAVDTGGTFTDLLLLLDGELTALKLPSTPHDPSEAVLEGIRQLTGGRGFELVHGSTVATNTLLERSGARVVLVTNRGVEDVLEIGRQDRPQLYALVGYREPPLVGRECRLGLSVRIGPDGGRIQELPESDLEELRARIGELEAEAVAVCFLHSYLDGTDERRVGDALSSTGLPISLSSVILPEFREYERTSTTVLNAYVQPRMAGYLARIQRECGAERVRIMASGGGSLTVAQSAAEPVHTILSGPAGGVVGAARWAEQAGFDHAITFDMGGTSTDVAVVPGRLLHTREFEIAGHPVATSVLDIHTVGAGGGSIARVDAGGALRVGPESAGAVPGPICYGRGGRQVTVTDAHVWLGRIPSEALAGGVAPDRESVREPLERLAGELGIGPIEAAEGILEVANATMERAIRVISVERGYDPMDFVLVGFGGAGGLHAAALAARIGARGAMIPPHPGLLSAWGMMVAPVRRELSRTVLLSSSSPESDRSIAGVFAELETELRQQMADAVANSEEIEMIATVDVRYSGQSFELTVPAADWVDAFHAEHELRYGYRRGEAPVEAVTLRMTAVLPGSPVPPGSGGATVGSASPPPRPHRVLTREGALEAGLVRREALPSGATLDGPLVISGYGSTCWVPPSWSVSVDALGCLHLAGRDGAEITDAS